MTLAQVLFLIALTGVLASVAWFAALVVTAARRSDGGSHLTWKLARRLQRSPTERTTEVNRWAFYVHRVTGFAVFGFLCLHIVDVSVYSISRDLYDQVHELYGSAPMRLFESGLLFAILFHTFNGLRLLAVDLADLSMQASKAALGAVATLTLLLGVAGSVVIMAPVGA
jgi:succinate dehydrogenase / fumarate reductase cytochrome b subunit